MRAYCITLQLLLLCLLPLFSSAQELGHILILNKSDNTAWYLDADSGEKVTEFKTGIAPHEVAVSPDQKWAVITNYGNEEPGHTLTLIDLEEKKVSKTIDLGRYQRPHGIEWFSDGKRVIVTAEDQQAVVIVDIFNNKVISAIKTNASVSHMATLSRDEARVYVTNIGSGSLTILDLQQQRILKNIPTGAGAEGLTIVQDGREIWVTNRASDTISIIDSETLQVIDTLKSSSFPIRAEASHNGRYVAVSNARSGTVTVFDADSRKKLHTLPTTKTTGPENGVPIGLTFSNDDSRLFVANSEANRIAVISTDTWEILKTFDTEDTPDGIAFIAPD